MFPRRAKSAIVVGCGQFGAMIAQGLFNQRYSVTVIDKDEDAFRRLHDSYSGYTVCADGASSGVLKTCGAAAADLLVASTDDDNTNILIAEIASAIHGIGQVYARMNDEEKVALFDGLNIEAICPHRLCLVEFEDLSGIDMHKKEAGL